MNYKEKVHKLIDLFILEYCSGDYKREPNHFYNVEQIVQRSSLHIFQLFSILGIKVFSYSDLGELDTYYFFDSNMDKVLEHTDLVENDEYSE